MGSPFVRYIAVILIAISLAACGGGGGGGGGGSGGTAPGSSSSSPPSITVSGYVQAPGGQIASLEQSNWKYQLASVFISSSHADVIGMTSVPNGTLVELVRVDPFTGIAIGAPLATTTVSAGRYSFNLTSLGLDYSTTLQARLASSTGIQMRTFITSDAANLDPNSEAGVELVLENIAAKPGSSLTVMSVKDLDDIVASVDMLTSASGLAAGTSVAATVAAIKTILNARPELSALLNTKLTAGHSDTGPGDIANYLPLSTGDTWTYSVSENGAAATRAEVHTVGTPTLRNGTMVMPVTNSTTSYPLLVYGPAPVLQDTDYYLKDATGLISYGNSSDPSGYTTLVPSYLELKLPAKIGDAQVAVDKTSSIALGWDLDDDRISETLTRYKTDHIVTGYQSITVPTGTYRCMVVESHTLVSMILSRDKATYTVTGTNTSYLAPGIGLVRELHVINGSTSDGRTIPQTTTQRDLVDATITGVNIAKMPPAGTQIKTVSLLHNDLVYDKTRNKLYASVPGSVINGNSIAVINPDTGTIEQTILIGPEPLRLALSKGDEYLYVGLDGSGEIARINLATMTSDLKFSLGSRPAPFSSQLFAYDIAVLPNNPTSIVISEVVKYPSILFGGVAVFDGAIKRPNEISGWGAWDASVMPYEVYAIAISDDGAFVYGSNIGSSSYELTQFSLTTSGITYLDQTPNLGDMDRMNYYGGRLYSSWGRVIDPINKALVGTYPVSPISGYGYARDCKVALSTTRTFCAYPTNTLSPTLTLGSFDRQQFTKLATVDTKLPWPFPHSQMSMVLFGPRGFAVSIHMKYVIGFYTPFDKLYLISSDIAL